MTVICERRVYVTPHFIRSMGGLKMGLTDDQKIDLAIAYVKKCDDWLLLMEVQDIIELRLKELLGDYDADMDR